MAKLTKYVVYADEREHGKVKIRICDTEVAAKNIVAEHHKHGMCNVFYEKTKIEIQKTEDTQ